MRKLIPALVVFVVATGFSLWAYPHLPSEVATHFDIQGDPDSWSSPLVAAALVPGLVLALAFIFLVLPRIDPRRANYATFTPTYWTIANASLVLLLGVHILVLGKALGWNINLTRVTSLGVGGLLIVMGNLMPRVRPNWFIGIRTPWTLSSDVVWRKTHRFGGAALLVAGLSFVASALLAATWARYLAIAVTVAAALGSVLYSYIVWKREQDNSDTARPAVA